MCYAFVWKEMTQYLLKIQTLLKLPFFLPFKTTILFSIIEKDWQLISLLKIQQLCSFFMGEIKNQYDLEYLTLFL